MRKTCLVKKNRFFCLLSPALNFVFLTNAKPGSHIRIYKIKSQKTWFR